MNKLFKLSTFFILILLISSCENSNESNKNRISTNEILKSVKSLDSRQMNNFLMDTSKLDLINVVNKHLDTLTIEKRAKFLSTINRHNSEWFNAELMITDYIEDPAPEGASLLEDVATENQTIRGVHTDQVRGLFKVLYKAYLNMRQVDGYSSIFDDYQFYMTPYKMSYANGVKYLEELNENDRIDMEEYCKEINNGRFCTTDDQIIKVVLEGRLSIRAQIAYKDTLIEHYEHLDSNNVKIPTIYNLGKLCPPKCPD